MFVFLVLMAAAAVSFAAYDSAKPADNEYVADIPALVRNNFRALKDDAIVNAGTVSGYAVGNQSGNIPINNTTLNIGLNADSIDNYHASDFVASSTYSASDLLLKLKTVDGSGSGVDSDLLDGYHVSTSHSAANTIPVRDSSGYMYFGWINTLSGDNSTTAPTRIYASHDGFIRYYTLTNFVTVTSMVTLTKTQTLTNKAMSTGCTWTGGVIGDAYIASTIARDTEIDADITTHAGVTATHGATGAVMGTTNTQTATNKTMSTGCTWNGNAVPVAYGGTGATSAAAARTNLGLGSAATMTGPSGSIVGTTDTQTLTNKSFTGTGNKFGYYARTSWIACSNGATTNLYNLGIGQADNYRYDFERKNGNDSTSLIYWNHSDSACSCQYNQTSGYIAYSNSTGSTVYVRATIYKIQ